MMRAGKVVLLFGMLTQASVLASAQATPTATASPLTESLAVPDLPGTLGFSVTTTARKTLSDTVPTPLSLAISGNVAYLSSSLDKSFSMIYSGGYLGGSGNNSSTFQNLSLSQSLLMQHWNFLLSDAVRYLPDSATVGLSGIAGLGDQDLSGLQPDSGQDILTNTAQRVTNSASGSASYQLTGRTSLTSSGTYVFQGFINSPNSLNSNQVMGMEGVNHQIDALSDINVSYSYSRFSYPSVPLSFIVQQANARYTRQWSRRLQTMTSIGPQWVSKSGGGSSSVNFSANAQLNYYFRNATVNAGYVRGVLGGTGIVPGARNDSVFGNMNYRLGRFWNMSLVAHYSHNSSLKEISESTLNTSAIVGGVQVSRKILRSVSAYASYTAQTQSTSGSAGGSTVFNGLAHSVGFGLTYSPNLIHLGQQ